MHGGWRHHRGGWRCCTREPTPLPLGTRAPCRAGPRHLPWDFGRCGGPDLACEPGWTGQFRASPAPQGAPGRGAPAHRSRRELELKSGTGCCLAGCGPPATDLSRLGPPPGTPRDPASCGPHIIHRASLQALGTFADPSGNQEPYASALWPSSRVWPFVSPAEHEKALSDEMPSNLTLACANCASSMGAFLTGTLPASEGGPRPPDTTLSRHALRPSGTCLFAATSQCSGRNYAQRPPRTASRGSWLTSYTDRPVLESRLLDGTLGLPRGLLLKGGGLACMAAWRHGTSTRTADGLVPTLSQARETGACSRGWG